MSWVKHLFNAKSDRKPSLSAEHLRGLARARARAAAAEAMSRDCGVPARNWAAPAGQA